ncbi:MAG: hypothetical protein IJI05_02090, partial [Erysipelotrichaceae bacterium]|nr:hypothetical protein [Erysipelotrichaceae bacterium]
GKKETVSCSFDMKDLASFDTENATMILENGDYIVRAGTSSANTTAAAVITLKKTVIVKQLRNKLNGKDVKDIRPERKESDEKYAAVKHFIMDEKAFQTETITYSDDYETDPAVEALTDEQAALLNIGAFKEKGGIRSIIGSAASAVAGAAGETASGTPLPFMVMADGPAGLRLARDYYEDAEGAHSMSGAIPESMLEMMPAPVRLLMKLLVKGPKKGTEIKHQYCTAIPIGTAIAQTFNVEAAKTFGDIVGQEMERFHVQLWLAPALNIHRSILCGRNFEYFSEDPLISGCFAAALTKGVQSHPGCGVTLKHYAANNQETNRYSSNSIVSERALREIYLKGFEICISEADPKAVMTSYNLINGLHASENRDLINDILRCEFGFNGIVMTDWIIANFMVSKDSKYQLAQPWSIAAAGGDLLMPGSADEYHNTLEAVKTGKISRRQLDINATRIYRMAKELTGHNPH